MDKYTVFEGQSQNIGFHRTKIPNESGTDDYFRNKKTVEKLTQLLHSLSGEYLLKKHQS